MISKLADLFIAFFKVGLLAFGGGYNFVPLIENQSVHVYKWITHDEFMKIIGAAETVPGAISIKYATYIGYKEAGLLGVAATVTGSFIVPVLGIIILFKLLKSLERFSALNNVLKGFRSAAWGLMIGLGLKSFAKTDMDIGNIIIGVGASLGIAFFNLSPALIVVTAGILSILLYS